MKHVLLIVAALALPGCDRGPPPQRPFVFTNASIALPEDTSTLPPGPNVEVVTNNCTACHSATMLTTQPALKPEQWTAAIKKMREVYKAPIADGDVPAIAEYLEAMSARQAAAR